MNKARRHVTNAAIILFGQGLSRGLGILLLPILTMVFLPEQFGISVLATTYISLVSVIALLGLDLTYLQTIPGALKPDAEFNARIIWMLTLVLATCAAFAGSIVWWLWGKQTPESAFWIGLGILSTVIFSVCQSQMKTDHKYIRLAISLSVGGVAMYAWVLMRSFSGHDQAVTLVGGYSLGMTAAVLVSRPRILLPTASNFPTLNQVFHLTRVGLPAVFIAPIFWIISSMDRWLVAQFWGVYEAGIYAVSASISAVGLLVGSVIQTIWMTEASRLNNASGGNCSAQLTERIKEILFIIALAWLALISISSEIPQVITRHPYDKAITYLPWLFTSVMLYNIYHALSVFLILDKKLGKVTIIWAFSGTLFVVLSILASRFFGPKSIAISQIFVYALMLAWVFLLVRKRAGLKVRFNSATFIMLGLVMSGASIITMQDTFFNLSKFIIKMSILFGFSALIAWHFKSQLTVIFIGKDNARDLDNAKVNNSEQ